MVCLSIKILIGYQIILRGDPWGQLFFKNKLLTLIIFHIFTMRALISGGTSLVDQPPLTFFNGFRSQLKLHLPDNILDV